MAWRTQRGLSTPSTPENIARVDGHPGLAVVYQEDGSPLICYPGGRSLEIRDGETIPGFWQQGDNKGEGGLLAWLLGIGL